MCQYCEQPEEIFDGVENKADKYIDYSSDGWYVEAYPTWDKSRLGTRIKLVFIRDGIVNRDKSKQWQNIEGWHLATWNHEFVCFEIGAEAIYCPVCGRKLEEKNI